MAILERPFLQTTPTPPSQRTQELLWASFWLGAGFGLLFCLVNQSFNANNLMTGALAGQGFLVLKILLEKRSHEE